MSINGVVTVIGVDPSFDENVICNPIGKSNGLLIGKNNEIPLVPS